MQRRLPWGAAADLRLTGRMLLLRGCRVQIVMLVGFLEGKMKFEHLIDVQARRYPRSRPQPADFRNHIKNRIATTTLGPKRVRRHMYPELRHSVLDRLVTDCNHTKGTDEVRPHHFRHHEFLPVAGESSPRHIQHQHTYIVKSNAG